MYLRGLIRTQTLGGVAMTEEPQNDIGESEPPQAGPPPQADPPPQAGPPPQLGPPPQADLPPPGVPTAFVGQPEPAPVAPHYSGAPLQPNPQISPTPPNAPFGFGPQAPGVAPVPPVAPADHWRAAAVALLNLSGLGLGYVLIRHWRGALACWLATAVLLLIALPATPDGVPIAVTVIYALSLLIAAVHGAIRALHTPLSWPPRSPVAFGLAIVLLAVPIGGTVLYDNAHENAIQQQLLSRLAQADAAIAAAEAERSSAAEPEYLTPLGTYRNLLEQHRTSKAAKLVPARLAAFYQYISGPYANKDYCEAVEPLTYLRTLPSTALSPADLGSLATYPDDPLATSLYQCGVNSLGAKADPTAAQDLNELMSTFPASAQAYKVEPAVAAAVGAAADGLTGADPCGATTTLTGLGTQIKALTSKVTSVADALKKDADTAGNDVETGTYDCAVSEYKGGKFSDAQTAMDNFVTTYPDSPNKALAQKYSIAAQIAQQDADAGKVVPNLTTGGNVSITIYNDSPDPMQILYTGPATGTVSIGACSSCKTYASDADGQQNACGNSDTNYPTGSFSLPPGTTYFLQKSTGANVKSYTHSEQYEADSTYNVCAFETKDSGPLGGL